MSLAVLSAGDGADNQIVFETSADRVRTWHEARMSAAARWATHEVYAGKPVREFQGPGLTSLALSVRLDIERGLVPRDELRKMRLFMNTGVVMQFTVGGRFFGDMTINSVEESWSRVDGNGVLTNAVVALSLEEYA